VGTRLLGKALEEGKREGVKSVIVRAGRQETQARRFYERNGFVKLKDETLETSWGKKLDLTTYELQLS